MGRGCSVCNHPAREAIDAELVKAIAYRNIAGRFGGVSISSLSRHRDHVAAALVRIAARRKEHRSEAGPATALARVEELYLHARRVLERAETANQTAQELAAIREARGLVELLAKITGELKESQPVTVVNILQSSEFTAIAAAILEALAGHPELRARVSDRLLALEASNQ